MSYSVTIIQHNHADKKGLRKVNIQVIHNRMKIYAPTPVKVRADQFENGTIVKHDLKRDYNAIIKEIANNIERRLLDALRTKDILTKKELEEIVKDKKDVKVSIISDFIYDFVEQGNLSPGRLSHYKVIAGKIELFQPDLCFSEVSVEWMNKFEAWLRKKGIDGNTVLSNMSLLKSIFAKAYITGLINEKQFKGYKRPRYVQKRPEYLTENEINKLFSLVKAVEKPSYKLAGYYYILSCFTGYRLSDAKAFDYNENMLDGNLVLTAKKNKAIVSTPIFPRLAEVLDYIKDKPLHLSEEKIRQYIKELFSLAGIKKDISFHSSRHSYAMMLRKKGMDLGKIAELIGDSVLITKIYGRIENSDLSKEIMEKLG